MSNIKPVSVLGLVLLIFGFNVNAASLSLTPGSLSVSQGSTFFIDLVISGLGDATAPSVGDFEVEIEFNPFALSLVSYSLGAELGDVNLGEAADFSFGETVPGTLNLAEVSFLADNELNTQQSDSFVLATLEFSVLSLLAGNSTSIVIADVPSLGDALGNSIAVDALTHALVVGAAPIPLPGAIWLFGGALGLLSLTRPKRRTRSN